MTDNWNFKKFKVMKFLLSIFYEAEFLQNLGVSSKILLSICTKWNFTCYTVDFITCSFVLTGKQFMMSKPYCAMLQNLLDDWNTACTHP